MAIPLVGMGIAAGGSALGGILAGKGAKDAAEASAAQAQAQFEHAKRMAEQSVAELEAIGVPTAEAQRIALEAAQLDPSAFEDIDVDPRLREAQMDALSRMQQFGTGELTEADRAQQQMMLMEAAGESQARDKAIMQDMAQRGMGGSGAELAQRLQSSQSGATRAAMAQAQMAGDVQNRALQAIAQGGQMGGQIRGQEYGEQSQLASARDAISRFNEANRSQTANEMERHNKALIQQEFANKMGKAQAKANARAGAAQSAMTQAQNISQMGQARAQAGAQQAGAWMGLAGDLGGATIKAGYGKPKDIDVRNRGYEDGGMVTDPIDAPNNNGGFAGGGIPIPEDNMMDDDYTQYLEGDVVPGDDFEGDRVDAKVNSGEMVINLEQQQRLMELLKGLRDLKGLGEEDIVEPSEPGVAPVDTSTPETLKEFGNGGMIGDFTSDTDRYSSRDAVGYEDGGSVEPVFTGDKDTYSSYKAQKPRGLHANLKHEQEEEEKASNESKRRKARMKAYETLLKDGR